MTPSKELPSALIADAEAYESAGRFADARTQYEAALAIRDVSAPAPLAPLLLRRVARCFIEQADFDAAVDCLDAAEASAIAHRDAVGVAHATNLRAICAQQTGDLTLAERFYVRARAQAARANASALVAMVEQNLGTVANIRGDLEKARRHYMACLQRYRALGMERPVTQVLNNLGMLYTDLGEWRAAENSFADAVRVATASGDLIARLRAEANRVELYIGRGRYRKARRLARRLLALRPEEDAQWVGETHKHLGIVARSLGDYAEAERCFGNAVRHARRRQDALLLAETFRELASVYQATNRGRETLQALNEAHALFAQLTATKEIVDLDNRTRDLEAEFLTIVQKWGSSIESVDRYTQGHCERVAEYACALARDAGIEDGVLLWFRMGALLHDVGKITVPAEVLNKRGPLTDAEFAVMKEHPARGEALVSGVGFPWDIRPMLRHHHERWDGQGYPDRLVGEQTPRAARILCIADVFDALTSTRSYRHAYSVADAVLMMRADAGSVFDPELLEIFLTTTLRTLESEAERVA
jgi:HD-GYP domain-containing protein (c-di-GMP phosphodiesterase class II)/predicted negative regulator of RcsB-dependent stress response